LQRTATLALSCFPRTQQCARLTLASSFSSQQQQIAAGATTAAAAAAAAPGLELLAVVANVASSKIRLLHDIQDAGRTRQFEKEAQEPLKKIRTEALQLLLAARRKHYCTRDSTRRN